MSDTYIPGFSNALQHYALGGRARAVSDNSDTYAMPSAGYSTKPELAANLNALLAAAQAGQNPEMDPVEARLVAGMQQPTYSPEFQGYLTSVNDYMAGLGNPEVGQFYRGIPLGRSVAGPAGGIKVWNPESAVSSYAQKPVEQNVGYYASLYDPDSDGLLSSGARGAVNVQYNTPIVLVNNRTGEIVAQGTGLQSAQDIVKTAQGLSKNDGGTANWSIFTGEPGSTDTSTYKQVAYDTPNTTVGDIAKVVAPIALQFIPGLGTALGTSLGLSGTAATMVGAGLTAALGRAGAGIASGDSVLDSLGAGLKTGAISGLTAGVLKGPSGGFGSAADISARTLSELANEGISSAVASALPSAAASGLVGLPGAAANAGLNAAGDIIVTGLRAAAPAVGGALSNAASSAMGSIINTVPKLTGNLSPAQETQLQESLSKTGPTTPADPYSGIEVIANRGASAVATPAATPAATGALSAAVPAIAAPSAPEYVDNRTIEVERRLPPKVEPSPTGALSAAVPAIATPSAPEYVDNRTIEVEGKPTQRPADPNVINAITAGVPALTGGLTAAQEQDLSKLMDGKSGTTLKDIADYMRLAGLGTGLLGDLFGGSKSGTAGTIPAGLGGAPNPVFSATLPTANLPGGTAATPRAAQDIDYNRYGYGPEQSFFSNVPQGAKNTSTAFTGYAHGGSAFAVGGPGDGREDKIPAMLSDGEYVMDAETVALLGNGSSKAGAQMLDKFRVNVRKQKGRKLAKGSFSDDAKAPEHYLKGRK